MNRKNTTHTHRIRETTYMCLDPKRILITAGLHPSQSTKMIDNRFIEIYNDYNEIKANNQNQEDDTNREITMLKELVITTLSNKIIYTSYTLNSVKKSCKNSTST